MGSDERTLWNLGLALGSSRIAHPAYQERPTRRTRSFVWSLLGRRKHAQIRILRSCEGSLTPLHQIINLHQATRRISVGCPGRHFKRNQLLGGSMGLSPLYPSQERNLRVTISDRPPSPFLGTSPCSGKDHRLSGRRLTTLGA